MSNFPPIANTDIHTLEQLFIITLKERILWIKKTGCIFLSRTDIYIISKFVFIDVYDILAQNCGSQRVLVVGQQIRIKYNSADHIVLKIVLSSQKSNISIEKHWFKVQ